MKTEWGMLGGVQMVCDGAVGAVWDQDKMHTSIKLSKINKRDSQLPLKCLKL